jgi:hypothetical protein
MRRMCAICQLLACARYANYWHVRDMPTITPNNWDEHVRDMPTITPNNWDEYVRDVPTITPNNWDEYVRDVHEQARVPHGPLLHRLGSPLP